MSTPVQRTWTPSHPDVQEIILGSDDDFSTRSLSKVSLPPFAILSKLAFPPCTVVTSGGPTYATVQIGRGSHINLNSDLVYINHSCEPSLIFDTANFNVLVGPKGLEKGDELTFFYPSTEWSMSQPFACLCGQPTCHGTIAGAKYLSREQLAGYWLNGHIRELLEERDQAKAGTTADFEHAPENGHVEPSTSKKSAVTQQQEDPTAQALRDALRHAEKVVEAARSALRSYIGSTSSPGPHGVSTKVGVTMHNGNGITKHDISRKMNGHDDAQNGDSLPAVMGGHGMSAAHVGVVTGSERRGPTSRELSGEMGGDTVVHSLEA